MNKSRLIGVLVLTVLFCSIVSFPAAQPHTAAQDSLSILVYTQYADTAAESEFSNTLTAINVSYGADFTYANLTDYGDLAAEIPGHNVFLILEQEFGPDIATMQTIGTLWAFTLQDFVASGGIVIVTDCYSSAANVWGPTLHILNESGLMVINGVEDSYPSGSISMLSVLATLNPLAVGVSSSWTPSNGTISVNTSEVTVVAEDNNGNPVVIHKVMGTGHVVYCGFDFFNTNTEYARILGNALGLQPVPPPIPGFPIEAIAIALVSCLGLGVVLRRRRKVN